MLRHRDRIHTALFPRHRVHPYVLEERAPHRCSPGMGPFQRQQQGSRPFRVVNLGFELFWKQGLTDWVEKQIGRRGGGSPVPTAGSPVPTAELLLVHHLGLLGRAAVDDLWETSVHGESDFRMLRLLGMVNAWRGWPISALAMRLNRRTSVRLASLYVEALERDLPVAPAAAAAGGPSSPPGVVGLPLRRLTFAGRPGRSVYVPQAGDKLPDDERKALRHIQRYGLHPSQRRTAEWWLTGDDKPNLRLLALLVLRTLQHPEAPDGWILRPHDVRPHDDQAGVDPPPAADPAPRVPPPSAAAAGAATGPFQQREDHLSAAEDDHHRYHDVLETKFWIHEWMMTRMTMQRRPRVAVELLLVYHLGLLGQATVDRLWDSYAGHVNAHALRVLGMVGHWRGWPIPRAAMGWCWSMNKRLTVLYLRAMQADILARDTAPPRVVGVPLDGLTFDRRPRVSVHPAHRYTRLYREADTLRMFQEDGIHPDSRELALRSLRDDAGEEQLLGLFMLRVLEDNGGGDVSGNGFQDVGDPVAIVPVGGARGGAERFLPRTPTDGEVSPVERPFCL